MAVAEVADRPAVAPTPPERRPPRRRLPPVLGDRLWPAATGLLALALTAVLANEPGRYVGDNRFEVYWAPTRRLARQLVLWDGGRGLGRVREDLWPGLTVPVAVLRGLGASPALAEHLFHALLLAAAGTGMVALLRAFVPRVGLAHAVAGAVYAFSPYSATFLVPSSLFGNYAIAPWLVLAAVQGTRGRRPWALAAAAALAVLAHGDADLPGLAYATVWALLASAWVAVSERAGWRAFAGWWARAALLTAVVAAPVAVKLWFGREVFGGRLFPAETPETVALASSWSETWRGLGFWVSYVPSSLGSQRPLGGPYYEDGWGVLATFALPLAALAGLWLTRWRPRLLFGAMAAAAVAVMVGAYPPADPAPYGRLLLRAYETVPALTALRTTYKAGSGLMMGTAALAGVAVAELARRHGGRRAVAVAAAAVVAVASFPFWTGRLYSETAESADVPGYWRDAAAFLDAQPGDARVLAVPGTTKTAYRWGWVGDDVLDTLVRRPTVSASTVPLSRPAAADVVAELDRRIGSGAYEAGMVAPVARRLGIGWVLVRNDVDWRRTRAARPARLQALRDDPALRLAATFGEPGFDVAGPDDGTDDWDLEADLPAVEVYAVAGAAGQVTARDPAPPLVVAGDGAAWPRLAERGWLDGGRALAYSADLEGTELADAVAAGAPVVVTDTNRRRLTVNRGEVLDESWTLAAGADLLDREVGELFDVAGAASVAVAADASGFRASGVGTAVSGFQPWLRPANAFDGDPRTVWAAGGLSAGVGSWVAVDLARPSLVARVEVTPYRPPGAARRVSAATLVFSDGSEVPVPLDDGGTREVTFAARETTSVELRVDAVTGSGPAPVGVADVVVPGLDLAEAVQVPTDVGRAGEALAGADVTYLFERAVGAGQPEELAVRRWFTTAGDRDFRLEGSLALGTATPDRLLDELLGGDVGAWGDERHLGRLDQRGGLAVDGDLATAWAAPALPGQTLHVRFPSRLVDHVDVHALRAEDASTLRTVRVTVGDRQVEAALDDAGDCGVAAGGADPCRTGTTVVIDPPVEADSLTVDVVGFEARRSAGGTVQPVRVAEVSVAPEVVAGPPTLPACADGLLTVDGRPVGLRLLGTAADAVAGAPVALAGCAPVRLRSGGHRLVAGGQVPVTWLSLSTGEPAAVAAGPAVEVLDRTPTSMRLRVRSAAGALVGTGQSHDPGWSASVSGEDLGPPRPLDVQSAWAVPPGDVTVELRYRPQRLYDASLLVSGLGVAGCVALLVTGRRRARG